MDLLGELEYDLISRPSKRRSASKKITKPKPFNTIYSAKQEKNREAVTPIYCRKISKKETLDYIPHPTAVKGFRNASKNIKIEFQSNLTYSARPKSSNGPRQNKKFEDIYKHATIENSFPLIENLSQKNTVKISDAQKNISNIGIQTDHAAIKIKDLEYNQEINTEIAKSTPDREKVSKTSFYSSNDTKHRALVSSNKISIDFKEFIVKYFINSSLDLLYIQVRNFSEKYEMQFSISPGDSILDIIHKEIYPKIQIHNGELILQEISFENVFTGKQVWKNESFVFGIDAVKPRSDLVVSVQKNSRLVSKKFEYIDVLKTFNDLEFSVEKFFCFIWVKSEEIELKPVSKKSIQLLYFKNHALANNHSYFIRISQVNFSKNSVFLIEAVSDSEEKLFPLLIDSEPLSELLNIPKDIIQDKFDLVIRSIYIENSQILISECNTQVFNSPRIPYSLRETIKSSTSSKVSLNSYDLIEKIEHFNKILNNFIYKNIFNIIKKNSTDLLLLHNTEKNEILLQEDQKLNTARKKIPLPEAMYNFYDKIFYRTCVTKNEKIFQISITLTKSKKNEDILVFYIRHGSTTNDMQKFSIDLKTICEKTGLSSNYLIPIGSYVVKHMLILGDNDISYLDFSKEQFNPIGKITKIQAIFRGVLQRKLLKIEKKQLLMKNKLLLNNLKWTCLIYADLTKLYIKLINGFSVATIELSKVLMAYDGNLSQIEAYIKKVIFPKIRIEFIGDQPKILGLEKFQGFSQRSRGSIG